MSSKVEHACDVCGLIQDSALLGYATVSAEALGDIDNIRVNFDICVECLKGLPGCNSVITKLKQHHVTYASNDSTDELNITITKFSG